MIEIFGTLGPACAQPEVIEKMFLEGMTGMRLNMSHSGLKESGPLTDCFWQAAQRAGRKAEFMIDMQGPEIRIGDLHHPVRLRETEEIMFVCRKEAAAGDHTVPLAENVMEAAADDHTVPVPENVMEAFETGDHVLLDDGRIELVITAKKPKITASVLRGGLLRARKSLKIADKQISASVITGQDKENIRLAKDYGVTALMQPFVTKGEQLLEVRRELLKNHLEHIRLFAKIENCEGIKNIRNIIPYADMIVIARGDLGNDMPLWELPAAQKSLSEICRREGKPFLVVTQLLASMEHNPYPTRAEVSDIFHAVLDGASAVMVTNETAVGKYPAEVIRYLKKTVVEAEKESFRRVGQGTFPAQTHILKEKGLIMSYETFVPVTGTIMNISRGSDCCSQMLAVRTDNGIVNFAVDAYTLVIDNRQLRTGMRVTAYYDSSLPVPLIFPPQYRAQIVAVPGRNEQVAFQYFNRNLLAADRSLQLNPAGSTVVQTVNGQRFACSPGEQYLMVFYSATTRSIPPQTTPGRIIVFC